MASLPKLHFPPALVFRLFHPVKQKTMDLAVAGCISAYDVTFGVDSVGCGERGSRNINPSEIAMTQQIAMSNSIDKCESHDLASRADAPTCSNLSTRILDRSKFTRTQQEAKDFALDETIRTHDLTARIDPPYVSEV